jgi:RIO-like serine/threonine protein kinase
LLGYVDPAQKELQQRLQNSGGKCKTLTLTQIKQATENFKTTIGIGGFGEVYYGKLVNGQEIAVKTLSTTSHQTKQEFFNEVTKFYLCKLFMLKAQRNCPDSYVLLTMLDEFICCFHHRQ